MPSSGTCLPCYSNAITTTPKVEHTTSRPPIASPSSSSSVPFDFLSLSLPHLSSSDHPTPTLFSSRNLFPSLSARRYGNLHLQVVRRPSSLSYTWAIGTRRRDPWSAGAQLHPLRHLPRAWGSCSCSPPRALLLLPYRLLITSSKTPTAPTNTH